MWTFASRTAMLVFAPLLRAERRRGGSSHILPTRIRAAVASDDRVAVSKYLSTRKNAAQRAVDARHPLNGETMLMIAASRGLSDMVSLLLSASPDVNIQTAQPIDGFHFSAVMAAAAGGHEDCVNLLIDAGARTDGVRDVIDAAHSDKLLSPDQHMKLRHCCQCCTADCACCATECACRR